MTCEELEAEWKALEKPLLWTVMLDIARTGPWQDFMRETFSVFVRVPNRFDFQTVAAEVTRVFGLSAEKCRPLDGLATDDYGIRVPLTREQIPALKQWLIAQYAGRPADAPKPMKFREFL